MQQGGVWLEAFRVLGSRNEATHGAPKSQVVEFERTKEIKERAWREKLAWWLVMRIIGSNFSRAAKVWGGMKMTI
jgi:hypothetical protein